jgi:hypothetical protein
MLRLDRFGAILGKVLLRRPDDALEPDGLDDLSDEEVTVEGMPLLEALGEGAMLADRCTCPQPWADDDGSCARCGHRLPDFGVAA